jgi:hypothetical protein
MSMTVQQLRDALNEIIEGGEGDKEVKFTYNYGDYWRTTVAEGISNVTLATVKYSDYHSMDKVVDIDEDNEAKPEHRDIYILE